MSQSVRGSYLLGTSPGFVKSLNSPKFINRNAWVVQPQGPIEVDWGNPITAGLRAVVNTSGAFRQGTFSTVTTTGPTIATNGGGSFFRASGSGNIVTPITPANLGMTGANARTIFLDIPSWPDLNPAATFAVFGDNTVGVRSYQSLRTGTFRALNVNSYLNDFTFSLWTGDATSARVLLAYRYDGGTGIKVDSVAFVSNGVIFRTSQQATLGGVLNTGSTANLELMGGGPYAENSLPAGFGLRSFVGWSRALSDAEITTLLAKPWQLFRPTQRRIWTPA